MTAAIEGQRQEALAFANFKDYILSSNGNGRFNDTSLDIISEHFYRELIALYDRYFPDNHMDDGSKFAYLKESITGFHGEPRREGNAVCIGVYKKGQARCRSELTEEVRERGGSLSSPCCRWFCDRVSYFTYSMVWRMTFHLPNGNVEHTFEETIYTAKEDRFRTVNWKADSEFEVYLEAKIHAYVMERMMNPRHKDHREFSQFLNQWAYPTHSKGYSGTALTWYSHPVKSSVTLSTRKELTFVWLYNGAEIGLPIPGVQYSTDTPHLIRVGQEKKDLFLRFAEELDTRPLDDHFIEIVRQKIEEVWGRNSVNEKQSLTAYLDWLGAKFDGLHAGLQRLKKEHDEFLNPPTFCCYPTEGPSSFEEVAHNLRLNGNVQDFLAPKAGRMAAHYQNIKNTWAQLYEVQEKIKLMKSLVEQHGPYPSPPLVGVNYLKVPPLDIKASLSEWEAVLDRWNSEAERVLGKGNNMESFCERVNSGVHRV
ncbi:MAG: hypothetical protein WB791_01300 [Waddliaceae bacterium]